MNPFLLHRVLALALLAGAVGCKPTVHEEPAPDLLPAYSGKQIQVPATADSVLFDAGLALGLKPGLILKLGRPRHGRLAFDSASGLFTYRFARMAGVTGKRWSDTVGYQVCQDARCVAGEFLFAAGEDSNTNCHNAPSMQQFSVPYDSTFTLDLTAGTEFCPRTHFEADTRFGWETSATVTPNGLFTYRANGSLGLRRLGVNAIANGDTVLIEIRIQIDSDSLYCQDQFQPRSDTLAFVYGGATRLYIGDLFANDAACPGDEIPTFQILQPPSRGNLTAQGDTGSTWPGIKYYVPIGRPALDSLSYTVSTRSGSSKAIKLYLKH